MREAAPLWNLYEDWKDLTDREREAIRAANWVEVRRCQRAKEQLQPKIIKVTSTLKTNTTSPLEQSEIDSRIRAYVNELIQMETHNSATLDQCMAELQKERASLDETSNRLRKVHQTYAPPSAPVWNQYS